MVWAAVSLANLLSGAPTNAEESRLISLARQAIVAQVSRHPMAQFDANTPVRPVFVTIEVGGKVRGCRGDLSPRTGSLEAEVVRAARSAASHDPRYRPVLPGDLKSFAVTVTVIDRMEPLSDVSTLRPADGLVLKEGDRTGVVLPFEGRDATTRLHWAFRKAGVPESDSVRIFRLHARRFRG